MNALFLSAMLLVTPSAAPGSSYEKIFDMKVADFEEFTVKDDRFLLNNVILKETSDGRRGQAAIKFAATIRNKNKGYEQFTIMLVGLDEKKTPIWVSKSSNSCDGNWVSTLQDYETAVAKGTLKATASVWVKLTVTNNSNEEE